MLNRKNFITVTMIMALTTISFVIVFGFNSFGGKVSIIFGGILTIFAMIFHILGGVTESFYYVASLINTISIGLFIAEFYNLTNVLPSTEMFILSFIICVGVLLFYIFVTSLSWFRDQRVIVNIVIIILLYAITITLWSTIKTMHFSLLFYMMHVVYFNIILLSIEKDSDEVFAKLVSWCYFGAALIVGFIVLIFISEGEVLGGLDGIGHAGGGQNKKSQM